MTEIYTRKILQMMSKCSWLSWKFLLQRILGPNCASICCRNPAHNALKSVYTLDPTFLARFHGLDKGSQLKQAKEMLFWLMLSYSL